MTDFNHVVLIGRLTRDADLKYTSGGCAVSSFSIAVNRSRKSGDQWVDEASFFDISLFGKSAENLKQHLVKGKQVAIDGELKQERWQQDGQPRSRIVVVANNIQLVGGQNTNNQSAPRSSYQPRQNSAPHNSYDSSPSYGDDSGFQEDIPF